MTLLVDAITRHQVNVQRFADGEARKALPILRELAKDLRARIQAGNATAFQAGRMIQLETEIRQIVGMRVSEMQMALDLEDFAAREMAFTTRLLGGYVTADLAAGFQSDMAANIVTQSQMRMLSGSTERMVTIPQLFDELSEAAGRQSMQLVQAGVIEGRTTDEIARDVYRGITNRARQQVTSVTRTAINHIGSQARQEVYNANSDIMEGERFLATLDARTTITCASFDREVFEIGQGPIPPLHFGCRSLRLPVVRQEFRRDSMGERASMNGPVSNQTTYGGWLKGQSEEFQNDVLGPQRAQLFRSGKVRIDRFTDSNGRVLTLDELSAREGIEIN